MFSGLPPRAVTSLSWINWFEGRSASVGKALGIGTGTVQRVLMKQPRPFDVTDVETSPPEGGLQVVAPGRRSRLARDHEREKAVCREKAILSRQRSLAIG